MGSWMGRSILVTVRFWKDDDRLLLRDREDGITFSKKSGFTAFSGSH